MLEEYRAALKLWWNGGESASKRSFQLYVSFRERIKSILFFLSHGDAAVETRPLSTASKGEAERSTRTRGKVSFTF